MWHWIKEDGERSSQVRPPLKEKIWTLNEMMMMMMMIMMMMELLSSDK